MLMYRYGFFCLFVSLFDLEFGIVLQSCIPIGIATIHILLCKHIYNIYYPPPTYKRLRIYEWSHMEGCAKVSPNLHDAQ